MGMLRYAEALLITLWVGSLWAIGYLAVPILFATLDDRLLAGMLAGRMFTTVSYIGLACGGVLLLLGILRSSRIISDRRVLLLALMMLMVALGEFLLQPAMAQLKAQGLVEGSDAMARFGMLHGVASLIYLVNSAAGLLLVLLSLRDSLSFRKGG